MQYSMRTKILLLVLILNSLTSPSSLSTKEIDIISTVDYARAQPENNQILYNKPDCFTNLEEIRMYPVDNAWVVSESSNQLIFTIPDDWQGNAEIYHLDDENRVGHLWSQFLMLSHGNWLTDRVESEGQNLENFQVNIANGKILNWEGIWSFRDYFDSSANHYYWVQQDHTFHFVRTSLDIKTEIPDVGGVWVELMNTKDPYSKLITETSSGRIEKTITGTTENHYLDQQTLGPEDWITLRNALHAQKSVPTMVMINSSQTARPRWYDGGGIDNIEIHLLNPEKPRDLDPDEQFWLEYLLITSPSDENVDEIDSLILLAKPILDIIKDNKIRNLTYINIEVGENEIEIGDPFNVEGRLQGTQGNDIVTIIGSGSDGTNFVNDLITDGNGLFSAAISPNALGDYEFWAIYAGEPDYYGSESLILSVKVSPVSKSALVISCLNDDNIPVSGAKVESVSQPGRQLRVVGATEENGTIMFKELIPGLYSFSITQNGYESITFELDLSAGKMEVRKTLQGVIEQQEPQEESTSSQEGGGIPGFPTISLAIGASLFILFRRKLFSHFIDPVDRSMKI